MPPLPPLATETAAVIGELDDDVAAAAAAAAAYRIRRRACGEEAVGVVASAAAAAGGRTWRIWFSTPRMARSGLGSRHRARIAWGGGVGAAMPSLTA